MSGLCLELHLVSLNSEMSCEQKLITKYQGCLQFHDSFEWHCRVCTAVGQIFEIIEFEASLLNKYLLL